jgi:hypothetical protein
VARGVTDANFLYQKGWKTLLGQSAPAALLLEVDPSGPTAQSVAFQGHSYGGAMSAIRASKFRNVGGACTVMNRVQFVEKL